MLVVCCWTRYTQRLPKIIAWKVASFLTCLRPVTIDENWQKPQVPTRYERLRFLSLVTLVKLMCPFCLICYTAPLRLWLRQVWIMQRSSWLNKLDNWGFIILTLVDGVVCSTALLGEPTVTGWGCSFKALGSAATGWTPGNGWPIYWTRELLFKINASKITHLIF